MQPALSTSVKKQLEIILSNYKDSYRGVDLRNQLYLVGIDHDIPDGYIKGFGDSWKKKVVVKYIFSLLNNEQALKYVSNFYTDVMITTSVKELFLNELNEKLSHDYLKIEDDGSITCTSMKKNKLVDQAKNLGPISRSGSEINEESFGAKNIITTKNNAEQHIENYYEDVKNKNKVFIVHGHDEAMKERVARVIEKLGLEPIILHEQPNKGKTTIEKFQANSTNVDFSIVLLSPDDVVHCTINDQTVVKHRARQNVILELGYFIGMLGRERVVALSKNPEKIDYPSDIFGVLYIPFENGWELALVQEIIACGINVDANKLIRK